MPTNGSGIGGVHTGHQSYQSELEAKPDQRVGQSGIHSVQIHPNVSRTAPLSTENIETKSLSKADWKIEKNYYDSGEIELDEQIFFCLEITSEQEAALRGMTKDERKQMFADFRSQMTSREWHHVVDEGRPLASLPSNSNSNSSAAFSVGAPSIDVDTPGFGVRRPDLNIEGPDLNINSPDFGSTDKIKKGFLKGFKGRLPSFSSKKKADKAFQLSLANKLNSGEDLNPDELNYLRNMSGKDRNKFQKKHGISPGDFNLGLGRAGLDIESSSVELETPKLGKGAKIKNGLGRFGRKLFNFFVGKPVTKFAKWSSRFGAKHFSSWNEKNQNNLFEASAHLSGIKKEGNVVEGELTPLQMGRTQMLLGNDGDHVADITRHNAALLPTANPALLTDLETSYPESRVANDTVEPATDDLNVNLGRTQFQEPQLDIATPEVKIGGVMDKFKGGAQKIGSKLNPTNWFGGRKKGSVNVNLPSASLNTSGVPGSNTKGGMNLSAPTMSVGMPQVYPSHAISHAVNESVSVDTSAQGSASTFAFYKYLVSQSMDSGYTQNQQSQHEQMVQQALIMEGMAHEADDGTIVLDGFDRGKAAMTCGWVNLASENPELMTYHYQMISQYNEDQRNKLRA